MSLVRLLACCWLAIELAELIYKFNRWNCAASLRLGTASTASKAAAAAKAPSLWPSTGIWGRDDRSAFLSPLELVQKSWVLDASARLAEFPVVQNQLYPEPPDSISLWLASIALVLVHSLVATHSLSLTH